MTLHTIHSNVCDMSMALKKGEASYLCYMVNIIGLQQNDFKIMYEVFQAYLFMLRSKCQILYSGLFFHLIKLVPRVYALSIERPTSREKANDRFASQLLGQGPRITCTGTGA